MSSTLNIRASRLQQQVAQHIAFCDDEITSLANYLQTLQMEIHEITNQIEYINNQQLLSNSKIENAAFNRQLKKQVKYSQEKINHQNRLQKMNIEHAEKIRSMTKDFENLLSEISIWSDRITSKKVSPIYKEINKVQKQIQTMEVNGISKINSEIDHLLDDGDSIENLQRLGEKRIADLESSLSQKKKQRYHELVFVKNQLSQCVATMDSITKKHNAESTKLKHKMETKSAMIDKRISEIREKYHHDLEGLRNIVLSSEEKAKKFEEEFNRRTMEFRNKMADLKKDCDQSRLEMQAITSSAILSQSTSEICDMKQKLATECQRTRMELDTKKSALAREYEINNILKREINKRKIDQRLEKRHEALK
ncbi:hypothetical protein TRFO_01292 [Tritrichomonas foetus]|uniref:Uncharacterized protein n=1 Tax=Tritrichomonas foetus TaxID=1144522 RepID=A0A1J4KCI1_9EUKA|nr:hypothetical protein TRFO_01292 [Tritrichomonas foetus]|eukprot:OHT07165.1 hypothetical protein TRFO_01292 [Tritrichomonas foetus]